MKKAMKTLMMLAMASMVAFTSCKKDDDSTTKPKPTVTFKGGNDYVSSDVTKAPGTSIKFGVTVKSEKLVRVKVTLSANGGTESTIFDTTKFADKTSYDGEWTRTIGTTGTEKITITATDDNGETASQSFTVSIVAPAAVTQADVTLGNQKDTEPKFWSSSEDAKYDLSDVKANPALAAKIDFGYATRNAGNMFVAPGSTDATDIYATQWSAADEKITTWTTRNNTKFKRSIITDAEFATALNSADDADKRALIAKAATAAGDMSAAATSIIVDDNIADFSVYFVTADGRKGVILVLQTGGTVNGGVATAGQANFQVIYEN